MYSRIASHYPVDGWRSMEWALDDNRRVGKGVLRCVGSGLANMVRKLEKSSVVSLHAAKRRNERLLSRHGQCWYFGAGEVLACVDGIPRW